MCRGSDSQNANISAVLVEVVARRSRGITSDRVGDEYRP